MEKYCADQKKEINILMGRLLHKRNQHSLTYRNLGAIVDAQPSTVWKWINGESYPSQTHIFRIKSFLKAMK